MVDKTAPNSLIAHVGVTRAVDAAQKEPFKDVKTNDENDHQADGQNEPTVGGELGDRAVGNVIDMRLTWPVVPLFHVDSRDVTAGLV